MQAARLERDFVRIFRKLSRDVTPQHTAPHYSPAYHVPALTYANLINQFHPLYSRHIFAFTKNILLDAIFIILL